MPRIVSDIVDVYPYRVIDGAAQFLVLKRRPGRRLGNTWQAVHGHIESGETAYAAARREFQEETSLDAEVWHQLECINTFFMADRDEIHMCPCFAVRVAAVAEPILDDEHVDYRWGDVDEAGARFQWPGQRRAVREIVSMILPGDAVAESLQLP